MRTSVKENGWKGADKKRLLVLAVTVLMCAIALFTLFWYLRTFLPVKHFVVEGVSQYEDMEIIEHSGIKVGDKLYKIDKDAAEARLKEECAYIEEVSVKRKFPNTVVITVEEKTAHWYVELSGDYYALDFELRVIEETVSNDKFVGKGIPQLVLPSVKRLMCGELPEFGENEREIAKVLELVSAVQSTDFKSRLTLVDVTSRFNVNIVVDGKYFVYMGDAANTSEKLRAVEQILETEELKKCVRAEIDASVPETTAVKRIFTDE